MSSHSLGTGWRQTTDGKWYPPESHPDAMQSPPGAVRFACRADIDACSPADVSVLSVGLGRPSDGCGSSGRRSLDRTSKRSQRGEVTRQSPVARDGSEQRESDFRLDDRHPSRRALRRSAHDGHPMEHWAIGGLVDAHPRSCGGGTMPRLQNTRDNHRHGSYGWRLMTPHLVLTTASPGRSLVKLSGQMKKFRVRPMRRYAIFLGLGWVGHTRIGQQQVPAP